MKKINNNRGYTGNAVELNHRDDNRAEDEIGYAQTIKQH